MSNIFTGLLFVFLDFDLTFNNIKIGLIPDFIGYFFMIKGITEMSDKSHRFEKIMIYVKVMLGYSALIYLLDIFALGLFENNYLGIILGLLSTIVSLYISYNIIFGLKDIESKTNYDLNANNLYKLW